MSTYVRWRHVQDFLLGPSSISQAAISAPEQHCPGSKAWILLDHMIPYDGNRLTGSQGKLITAYVRN